MLLYHKSVNEARRFTALADIWVKKSGSNLGQTAFAIVSSKAQVRKRVNLFRSIFIFKSRFFRRNAHFQQADNLNYLEDKQKKSSDFKKKSELYGVGNGTH